MAGSVNKVILIGNVGRDPEVRSTQDGTKIVQFSLATSEYWNDRATGERKERTEWHRIVCFNERLGEIIEKYVRKGSKVYIEGTLQTRKWTDQSGQDKYTTEVVLGRFRGELTLLDSRGSGEPAGEGGYAQRQPARSPAPTPAPAAADNASTKGGPSWDAPRQGGELDDEIPF